MVTLHYSLLVKFAKQMVEVEEMKGRFVLSIIKNIP